MSDFDFIDREPVPSGRGKSGLDPAHYIIVGILVIGAIAVGGFVFLRSVPVKLSLAAIETQTVNEHATLSLTAKATAQGLKEGEWTYRILTGPPGAKVDSKSGVLTWKPTEDQGPGEYTVTVAAQAKNGKQGQDQQTFQVIVQEVNQPPEVAAIPNQEVVSGQELKIAIHAKDDDKPVQKLTYRLKQGPKGAEVDASSGAFTWSAPHSSTEQTHEVEIIVADAPSGGAESVGKFAIHVKPPAFSSQSFIAALREAGLSVEKTTGTSPGGFHGTLSYYQVNEEALTLLDYDNDESATDEVSQITDGGKTLFGEPAAWPTRTSIYCKGPVIAMFGGASDRAQKVFIDQFGPPYAVAEASKMKPAAPTTIEPTLQEKLISSLAKRHERKDLLGKTDYPGVRKLFVEVFEKQNEFTLERLGQGDGVAFRNWLNDHAEFKEEFFLAVGPNDDFVAAYKILQTLHQKFRKIFDDYGQLAIATALVWDNELNIVHYDDHQRRTHSRMPTELSGAVDNFQYFAEMAEVMQGRAQYLPWEFLVFMINDKTPRMEREWAAQNYVAKRTMFGKCYSDVPYDSQMLKTESRICKLDGKDYTLPNILQFGGVCAMQADFASRVGKSIGVPAEYVAGEAAGGERHAWVMWVEVKQASRSGISFTLESHGRYRGDKYYVGTLRDPQSGQTITDRHLELRLQAVGLSPVAYHHAKLVMLVYPQLREKMGWKPAQEIIFLNEVIDICPGNEDAWRQVAFLSRDGKIGTDSYRLMTAMFDKLFRTFANFPDFTWTVFDDLVQFQKNPRQRDRFYDRLIQLYESADRPDLASEARLKFCDYLLEEGKGKDVIEGLAYAIKKFPDEGRYVPKMLDKLEKVCAGVKGADQLLLQFYLEFIPLIPPKRGSDPSPYCMRMLERATAKFKAAGQTDQAQIFAAQLAQLEKLKGAAE